MEQIRKRQLAEVLVKLYSRGLEFYSAGQYNIDPEERKRLYHKTLLQWNYWQGVLDGKPSD